MWQKYPSQNPETPARTIDGEAIVITPHDSRLHTLNDSATFIWDRADGSRRLEEIIADLVETFDTDERTARQDAEAFVREAVEKGLMLLHESPTPLEGA